jgi:isopentenyldiphosphate isomerase
MTDELIDIYDVNNKSLGISKMKSEAHRDGLWHRAVIMILYNSKGEILLQKRAKDKEVYPDRWDVAAAGHVGAGEEPVTAALRELAEEIGIFVKENDLHFVGVIKARSAYLQVKDKEHVYVYFLKYDGKISDLKLQKEEVQDAKFISTDALKQEIENNFDSYVPRRKYWNQIIRGIKGLLEK